MARPIKSRKTECASRCSALVILPRLRELIKSGAQLFTCTGFHHTLLFARSGKAGQHHAKAALLDIRVGCVGSASRSLNSFCEADLVVRIVGRTLARGVFDSLPLYRLRGQLL